MIRVKCGLDIFFTYINYIFHIRNVTFHIKITEIGVFFHMWHKTWHINMSLPHVLMRFALFGHECDNKTFKMTFSTSGIYFFIYESTSEVRISACADRRQHEVERLNSVLLG